MSSGDDRRKGNCPPEFSFAKFECEQIPPVVEHASHLPPLCTVDLATRCTPSGFTSTPALEDPPEEPPELWPPEAATRGINSGDTVTPALLLDLQFPPQRPHFGAMSRF